MCAPVHDEALCANTVQHVVLSFSMVCYPYFRSKQKIKARKEHLPAIFVLEESEGFVK